VQTLASSVIASGGGQGSHLNNCRHVEKQEAKPMPMKKKRSTSTRRYGKAASNKVQSAMSERKRGTLRSGRSAKKVTSRKQAVAIGLSQARRAGGKVPRKRKSA
jgi:hypothetical protein